MNTGMLVVIHDRYQDSYYAALVDKIALLENSASPRLIFVGGSNVAFGVDSQTVQEQSGYHVVNMGLNGNLGIRFMLSVVKPTLRTGDVVVIMPEYQQFFNAKENVGPAFVQALIANPVLLQYVSSPIEIGYMAELFPYIYTQAIKSIWQDITQRDCLFCVNDEQIYFRSAFNAYGDIISHEDVHPTREIAHINLRYNKNNPNISHTISIINKFAKDTETLEIKIFIIYPATPSPINDSTISMLNYLDARLKKELKIPVLGNLSDAWYSTALFFDTYYHLTPQGRFVNTNRIVDYLLSIE